MAALLPTAFIDQDAQTIRAAEVPNADFINGGNWAGSCAVGVGINFSDGAAIPVIGSPEQFTLLDQNEAARAPQLGQHIGGDGLGAGNSDTYAIAHGTNGPGDGSLTEVGANFLNTLALGWVDT